MVMMAMGVRAVTLLLAHLDALDVPEIEEEVEEAEETTEDASLPLAFLPHVDLVHVLPVALAVLVVREDMLDSESNSP